MFDWMLFSRPVLRSNRLGSRVLLATAALIAAIHWLITPGFCPVLAIVGAGAVSIVGVLAASLVVLPSSRSLHRDPRQTISQGF